MEDLIPVLFMIGYLVLRFIGKLAGGKSGGQVSEQGPVAKKVTSVDDVLRELMGELGVEPPVEMEHRPTRSEHQETFSEHHGTFSESQEVASEHRQAAGELFATASEHRLRPSEHELSWGEHLKGDLQRPSAALEMPATAGGRSRSKFGKALVADLRGGSKAMARAMVLREILGPPVGLRSGGRS